jgi:hypothetical protein
VGGGEHICVVAPARHRRATHKDLLEKQVDQDRTNVASDFRTVLATTNLASHLDYRGRS